MLTLLQRQDTVSVKWTDKLKSEDKEYTVVLKKKIVQCFGVHYTFFVFPRLVTRLKSGSSYRG